MIARKASRVGAYTRSARAAATAASTAPDQPLDQQVFAVTLFVTDVGVFRPQKF